MSNSTTLIDQVSSTQATKEVIVNANFDAASPAMLWGRRSSATAGLTWGYYGGTYYAPTGASAVANGTVTLTASATNYVYASAITGAVSVNTTGFPVGAIPLYTIVAGATTVSSYTDVRSYQPSATANTATGTVTSVALSMPAGFSVSNSPVTGAGTLTVSYSNQPANCVHAGPVSGSAAAPTWRALVGADVPMFGPSGSTHAPGGVPDPGSAAGATRYLCENGTWAVPAGGGGGSGSGTVTDIAATGGIETATGADITTSGTLRSNLIPNVQTAAYTFTGTERGTALVLNGTAAITQELPSGTSFPDGWHCDIVNISAFTVTLTVASGVNLSGVANGTLSLSPLGSIKAFTDGTNWFTLGGVLLKDAAGMFTANHPKSSQFTALRNTGIGSGGAIADLPSGRGFSMVAPSASTGDNLLLASQAAPSSGAWTVTALLNVSMIASSSAYSAAGLCVGDSSGKFVDFAIWAAGGPSNLVLSYHYWNSLNSFNSSHNQQSRAYATMLLWMRVVYNGTTFAFSTSVDGETWSNAASVSATAFIGAPATCGLFVNSNAGAVSTTADTAVSCYHYSQG